MFLTGLLLLGLLGGTAVYFLYLGARLHRDHFIQGYEQTLRYVLETNLGIPVNAVKGMLAPSPEMLVLDIKHLDYQRIAFDRDRAFKTGFIPEGEYVPATLTHSGQPYRVRARLHGQYLDHVASEKWSLRIRFRDDEALFGMTRFNVMAPKTRYGVYEWVCHELSRREGLIALRTDFVGLSINGKYKGIYYLEEVFDKRLIESHQRREGIVFRPLTPIRIHERDKVLETPELRRQLALLETLYDRFLTGDLPASKLFDVEKLARYYAITDLVAGHHQLIASNVHLYFNPVTGLVEPIGREWDVHFYRPHDTLAGELAHEFVSDELHSRALADPVIFSRYVQELERMSRPEFLQEFFSELEPRLTEKLNILYKDYPYYSFSKDYFYEGQRFIRNSLTSTNALRAYHRTAANGQLEILLRNRERLPLEVVDLTAGLVSLPRTQFPQTIARRPVDGVADYQILSMAAPAPEPSQPLKIRWRVQGASTLLETDVLPWPFTGNVPDLDLTRLEPNHEKFPFIRTDPATKTVHILPGEWDVTESLIFPPEHTIRAQPGTILNLKDSASILSYSRLVFQGSAEEPVVIRAESGDGGAVAVYNAKTRSTLEHVHVTGLSNPSSDGWELPGSLTFYESPVDIRLCQFSANARGDDLVNIIRSDFTLSRSTFSNALSDALDVDFGTGSITDTRFVSSGNDAIDASGSRVLIDDVLIDGTGDKGLSAGEDSWLSVVSATIRNAEIAVASKDRSLLEISNSSVSSSNVGFAAYRKKPEFGPGTIRALSINLDAVETQFLVEQGSTMLRDQKALPAEMQNVEVMLYGVEDARDGR